MSNLSYCRFRNTFSDYYDCFNAVRGGDFDDFSKEERLAFINLVKRSQQMIKEVFSGCNPDTTVEEAVDNLIGNFKEL